jgi:hypothetical protein
MITLLRGFIYSLESEEVNNPVYLCLISMLTFSSSLVTSVKVKTNPEFYSF